MTTLSVKTTFLNPDKQRTSINGQETRESI